jgi:hypothetical protein
VKIWTIYALICPLTLSVRYIGITSGKLQRRLYLHLCGKDHNPDKGQWIAGLSSQGLKPDILSIDSIIGTRPQAEQRECYWIYEYIIAGHDLLNTKHIPGDRELFFEFLRNQSKGL